MSKILIIIQREYITRVRKRTFIISTLLAPLGFFALILFSVLMSNYSGGTRQVAISDESGLFGGVVFPDATDGSVEFHYLKQGEAPSKKYDAIIRIPSNYDIDNPRKVSIACTSDKSLGMMASTYINKVFSDKVRQVRATKMNITQEQLENLNTDIELSYQKLSEDKKKDGAAIMGMLLGYVIGIAIYTLLLVYGTMIMKGIVEEKSSRIMEVLVSSVKPIQLMIGKILGIAAVGLTQFVIWIILITCTFVFLLPAIGIIHPSVPSVTPVSDSGFSSLVSQNLPLLFQFHYGPMLVVLLLFFLGGFLLYGSLFAAIGAAGGDETDSQSLTFPVILPIIITIAMMTNILGQPDGKLAFWASLVPFCSPIIMPALMPTNPPIWQILLSLTLLFAGFLVCVSLAARIYRTGILMYGKKTSFREIGRWLFMKS
ncbi:MAG: ABC transporter permease [Bacteroidetes bacterium]|nr:ABC transporter permease [Bacteroidota bacterium]